MRTRAHILLLALLCLLAYSNTMDVPFAFDDQMFILTNPMVTDSSYLFLPGMLKSTPSGPQVDNTIMTRYLGHVSFNLNYALFRKDVRGYHAFNLAIHILSAIMVYLLVRWLAEAAGAEASKAGAWIALWCAMLFALHPVQTQAITYLSQRLASMVALFYIASVALYVRHRLTGRLGWLVGSLLLAIAAVHTKENAFTIPATIALIEWLFFSDSARSRALRLLPYLLVMLVIPYYVLHVGPGLFADAIKGGGLEGMSRSQYFITSIRVMATYLRLMILPVGLVLDYGYPIYDSFLNAEVLASLALILAMIGWALLSLRSGRPLQRLAGFGIIWFFVTVSVENSIIVLLNVIFEHRLYLPSVGLILAAVCMAYEYSGRLWQRRALALMGACVLIVMLWATHARNEIWRVPARLWADNISRVPNNNWAYGNMVVALESMGETESAEILLSAIESVNDNWHLVYGAGSIALRQGRHEEALEKLQSALKMKPNSAHVNNMLGVAYMAIDQIDKGLLHMKLALHLDNTIPNVSYNLGVTHLKMGAVETGKFYLENAIRLDSEYALAYSALGEQLLKEEDYGSAEKRFRQALDADPGMNAARYSLAMMLLRQDRLDAAEAILSGQAAETLDANAHALLGLMRALRSDWDGAVLHAQRALEIEPDNAGALRLKAMIDAGGRK